MDRRSINKRPLRVLPDLSGADENRARFPEINEGTDTRKEKKASLPFDRKGFSPLPETVSKKEPFPDE
jgi:hypothetical protein